MEFFLPRTEIWYQKCDQARSQLNISSDVDFRIYPGIHFALFEICQATSSFYSHKKSMAYLRGQSFALSAIVPYFYRESFQVQSRPSTDSADDLVNWVSTLNKDCLLAVLIEDNPVTGEIFNNDTIDRALNEKKIFSVRISHRKSWVRGVGEIQPYTIWINECDMGHAVVLLGSKYKVPVGFAKYFLPSAEFDTFLKNIKNEFAENSKLLAKFEKQIPPDLSVYKTSGDCLSDRILIFHPEIHGSTLAEELKKVDANLCYSKDILSLSSCSEKYRELDWWEDNQLSPEQVRSMVVLSLSAVEILFPKIKQIEEVLQKCLR